MTTKPESWLAVARKKLGKTQKQIADELDIVQAAVSHWEHTGAIPRPSMWSDVATAYGVSHREVKRRFMEVLESRGADS